jgi:1,4-dihydroxy-2-naphthoate octaprenyltransferase
LLLLNQFPDLEADKDVGRRHLPILIGRRKSAWIYVGFLVATYGLIVLCVYLTFLPISGLLGLVSLVLAIPAAFLSVRYANDMERLKPALALNVAVTLSTPVLVAIGIVLQQFLA